MVEIKADASVAIIMVFCKISESHTFITLDEKSVSFSTWDCMHGEVFNL